MQSQAKGLECRQLILSKIHHNVLPENYYNMLSENCLNVFEIFLKNQSLTATLTPNRSSVPPPLNNRRIRGAPAELAGAPKK